MSKIYSTHSDRRRLQPSLSPKSSTCVRDVPGLRFSACACLKEAVPGSQLRTGAAGEGIYRTLGDSKPDVTGGRTENWFSHLKLDGGAERTRESNRTD